MSKAIEVIQHRNSAVEFVPLYNIGIPTVLHIDKEKKKTNQTNHVHICIAQFNQHSSAARRQKCSKIRF